MYIKTTWKVILTYVKSKKSFGRLCQCSKMLRELVESNQKYLRYIARHPFVEGRLFQMRSMTSVEKVFSNEDLLLMRLDLPALRHYSKGNIKQFYFGRCIEYIYDRTDFLISVRAIDFGKFGVIIDLAHELKAEELVPKEGESFYHIYCACHNFIVGNKFCSCGSVELEFCGTMYCTSLDDKQIHVGIRNAEAHRFEQMFRGPIFDAIGGYILRDKARK